MGKKIIREREGWLGKYYEVQDEDEENEALGEGIAWLLMFVVPVVINALVTYHFSGGSLSDFKNDTWVQFIRSHYLNMIIRFVLFTLATTLLASYLSDLVGDLLPKIAWVFGAAVGWFAVNENVDVIATAKAIGNTESLVHGAIIIGLTIGILCFCGLISHSVVLGYQTLGYIIREKFDDILDRFRG
jgi:hypothetical protein